MDEVFSLQKQTYTHITEILENKVEQGEKSKMNILVCLLLGSPNPNYSFFPFDFNTVVMLPPVMMQLRVVSAQYSLRSAEAVNSPIKQTDNCTTSPWPCCHCVFVVINTQVSLCIKLFPKSLPWDRFPEVALLGKSI